MSKLIFSKTGSVKEYKPIYEQNGKWHVCFNYKEQMKEEEPKFNGKRYVKSGKLVPTGEYSCNYIVFDIKPSVNNIRYELEEIINDQVTNKITNNFVWNGNKINLSKENQMNYKSNYDLAVQTSGSNLPYRIKTRKNGNIEYISFFIVQDFTKFYIDMQKHINNCIEEGWKQKEEIDYSVYK